VPLSPIAIGAVRHFVSDSSLQGHGAVDRVHLEDAEDIAHLVKLEAGAPARARLARRDGTEQ